MWVYALWVYARLYFVKKISFVLLGHICQICILYIVVLILLYCCYVVKVYVVVLILSYCCCCCYIVYCCCYIVILLFLYCILLFLYCPLILYILIFFFIFVHIVLYCILLFFYIGMHFFKEIVFQLRKLSLTNKPILSTFRNKTMQTGVIAKTE